MAGTPYLVDSNVLLRWVKPNHRDYPLIVSATDAILRHDGVLCYTSQNVGEFWNACTRPVDRNGYGFSPQETDRPPRTFEEKLRLLPDSLTVHEEWRRLLVTHSVSGVQVHEWRLPGSVVDANSRPEGCLSPSVDEFFCEEFPGSGFGGVTGLRCSAVTHRVSGGRRLSRARIGRLARMQ